MFYFLLFVFILVASFIVSISEAKKRSKTINEMISSPEFRALNSRQKVAMLEIWQEEEEKFVNNDYFLSLSENEKDDRLNCWKEVRLSVLCNEINKKSRRIKRQQDYRVKRAIGRGIADGIFGKKRR